MLCHMKKKMYLNAVGLFTVAQNEGLLRNNSVTRNILNIIMNDGPKIKSTNELKKCMKYKAVGSQK